MKTYYELLGIQPDADPEEIKRAFRREIARYHPDKVQHLGPEFQEIAASRAAELTEAYRILMDPQARRTYDASVQSGQAAAQPAPAPAAETARTPSPSAPPPPPSAASQPHVAVPESLRQTQETLSQFVKKATIGRLREAIEAVFGQVEPLSANGFDAAFALRPRRGLFQKAETPVKLLVCVVRTVTETTVQETWPHALKMSGPDAPVCVFLLGLSLAPPRELAAAIAEQRRRSRQVGPVVVPVDARDWDALLPPDTPAGVRKLLERLKLGT